MQLSTVCLFNDFLLTERIESNALPQKTKIHEREDGRSVRETNYRVAVLIRYTNYK